MNTVLQMAEAFGGDSLVIAFVLAVGLVVVAGGMTLLMLRG
jgi:hypothetical protein